MPARRALALALLLLGCSGCSLAGRTLGGYVDDARVRHAVKRRLTGDGVARQGVKVDTFGGTVYLSGEVETAVQKSDAEIAAWQIEGVEQVVNDLVVRQPPAAASALPDFSVGQPLTERLPGVARVDQGRDGGPDLAYDGAGRVVATIYVVSWRDLVDKGLSTLAAGGRPIDHVSTYALLERQDVPGPRYAVVLWHVSEREAATQH